MHLHMGGKLAFLLDGKTVPAPKEMCGTVMFHIVIEMIYGGMQHLHMIVSEGAECLHMLQWHI